MEKQKKYCSLNVERSVINRLKVTAAKRGWMRYSIIAEEFIIKAYKQLESIEKYSEVLEVFKKELDGFTPMKRGKPAKEFLNTKMKLTLYLSPACIKYLYRINRRFGLSISGVGELLLRIGLRNEIK